MKNDLSFKINLLILNVDICCLRTNKLDVAIGCHLTETNILCTDSRRAFSSYANKKKIEHFCFKLEGKQRVKGVFIFRM